MRVLCIFLVLVNVIYFLWQMRTQDSVADLPVDSAASTLILLSELPTQTSSALSVKPQINPPPSTQPNEPTPVTALPQTQGCIVLGGFVDQAVTEQVAGLLSGHGIASKLHTVETQGESSYLVYLPPFASHAEALTKLRELKAKAIDSFIIADGERVNGISLGVFAKEESAKKLQSQLSDKGYNTSLTNTARVSQQYTLQVNSQLKHMLTEPIIREISQKYAGNKLTEIDSPCTP